MDDFDQFERSLAAALRSDADLSVARFEPGTIAYCRDGQHAAAFLRIALEVQRRARRPIAGPVAAAVVIGVLVVGGAFFMLQRNQPAVVAVRARRRARIPAPAFRASCAPSSTPSGPSAPTSSGVPSRKASGSPPARWARLAPATPRCGSSTAGCSWRVAPTAMRRTTSAELYDPDSGTWSATGNMLKPHGGFPATLLRDGKVLVGDVEDPAARSDPIIRRGGVRPGQRDVEPPPGGWSRTTRLGHGHAAARRQGARDGSRRLLRAVRPGQRDLDRRRGRWSHSSGNHTAILLPDGKVLVAGGLVLRTTTDWTPPSCTTRPRGPGPRPRTMHGAKGSITATLLPDGKVLVVGGTTGRPRRPPSCTTRPPGPGPSPGTWPGRDVATVRPRCCRMAGCSWSTDDLMRVLYDPGTGSWTATGTMLGLHADLVSRRRCCSTAPSSWLVASDCSSAGSPCAPRAQRSCTSLPACRRHPRCQPSRAPRRPRAPTPSPTPVPPEVGPVPPGARSWTVRVVNDSARPATLFVAEDDGMAWGGWSGA